MTKSATVIIIIVLASSWAGAQPYVGLNLDFGDNNVSEGIYLKSGFHGSYNWEKYRSRGGFQLNLKSDNRSVFSGMYLIGARKFWINEFDFDANVLFVYAPFSELLQETNWGVYLSLERKHFRFKLGTGFRTYSFTNNAADNFDIDKDMKMHENWNLLYTISYYIMKPDTKWNLGFNITNLDNFVVYQETNPVYNIEALYKISAPITLYLQPWYQASGSFNLNVNYFGFFVRGGVIWNLGMRE